MSFAMLQEIEKIKRSCILCGKCTAACPSASHGGIDPMEIMAGGEGGLDCCIMCGTCSRVCHRSDPFKVIRGMIYIERHLEVPKVFEETGFVRKPAEDRLVAPEWSGDETCVMIGCVADSMAPFLEFAASVAMDAVGVPAKRLPGESCCLHPVQFMGMSEHEKRSRREAICGSSEGRPIVTLCAGCSEELLNVSRNTEHIIRFLYKHLEDLPHFERSIKIGMEPGCSAEPFAKEMRAVLEKMNCTVVNSTYGCCGKSAPVSAELMEEREDECAGSEIVVVGCPMCFVKFDSQKDGRPVVHISELVAMAAGRPESLGFHRIPVTGFRYKDDGGRAPAKVFRSGPRIPRRPWGTSP